MFIDENGTQNVKWLTSRNTKISKSLYFVINEHVCFEFEKKLQYFADTNKLTVEKANQINRTFSNYYKNKYFRVIGQKIISNTKKEVSIDEIIIDLNLRVGHNDWDGLIYQSIVNALAYLGGNSTPILVTCDDRFGKKFMRKGYQVINPMKHNPDDILAILE